MLVCFVRHFRKQIWEGEQVRKNETWNYICKRYYIKVEWLIKITYQVNYNTIYNIRQTTAMNKIPL